MTSSAFPQGSKATLHGEHQVSGYTPAMIRTFSCPVLVAALLAFTCSCSSRPKPGDPLRRAGDEISVAGQLFHTGTRVVLWNDAGGFDAYRPHQRFDPSKGGPRESPDKLVRFGSFRGRLPEERAERVRQGGWTLEDLRATINQVVVHFDACGTSRRCFEVLHDVRGLSCHFLLDVDGTIYQTLDLKERAWHASQANDQSVGIEIANIGAYEDATPLKPWYATDASGTFLVLPAGAVPGVAAGSLRPDRSEVQGGRVQGKDLVQYDFTPEQYQALERLLVALRRTLPGIAAAVPRDASGKVLDRAFESDEELFGFRGVLGHYHVSREKVDPGPAFQWERILDALRRA